MYIYFWLLYFSYLLSLGSFFIPSLFFSSQSTLFPSFVPSFAFPVHSPCCHILFIIPLLPFFIFYSIIFLFHRISLFRFFLSILCLILYICLFTFLLSFSILLYFLHHIKFFFFLFILYLIIYTSLFTFLSSSVSLHFYTFLSTLPFQFHIPFFVLCI